MKLLSLSHFYALKEQPFFTKNSTRKYQIPKSKGELGRPCLSLPTPKHTGFCLFTELSSTLPTPKHTGFCLFTELSSTSWLRAKNTWIRLFRWGNSFRAKRDALQFRTACTVVRSNLYFQDFKNVYAVNG